MSDIHYEQCIALAMAQQLKLKFMGDFLASRFMLLEKKRFDQLSQSVQPVELAAIEICYCLLYHHADAITHYNGALGAALYYLHTVAKQYAHTELGSQAKDYLEHLYHVNSGAAC